MKTFCLNSKSNLPSLVLLAATWISPAFTQDGEGGWTKLKSMSTERFFGQACYLESRIYITGGYNVLDLFQAGTEVYDINLNEWTTLANMHLPRIAGALETCSGEIYAIGGIDGTGGVESSTVEEYDPDSDIWTELGSMPKIRYGHASCIIDNKVYVFGGQEHPDSNAVNNCLRYDLTSHTWDTISSLNYSRSHSECGLNNGKVYVFGGTHLWGPEGKTNRAEVYDPARDSWTDIKSVPESMIAHSAISAEEDKLILLIIENRMYAYYPERDEYVRMKNIPLFCYASSVAKAGRYIYIMGGAKDGSLIPSAEIWGFNLDSLKPYALPTVIKKNITENMPGNLSQIYPNPFNESVEISYKLTSRAKVRLEIYNCPGMKIESLVNEFQSPGEYSIEWNTENIDGGAYFCVLEVDGHVQTKQMIKQELNR